MKDEARQWFGTLERTALPGRIADRILTLIKERQLSPGDKLPAERELADLMDVSRPPIREALHALSIMNVVRNRHGSGWYVTSLEPDLLVEHLDLVFTLQDNTYLELFQARKVLEVGMAEMAASSISPAEIAQLVDCLERSEATVNDDPDAFLQADLRLHAIIASSVKNPILTRMASALARISLHSRQRTNRLREVRHQAVDDHRAIVRALRARDPQAVRDAMLVHLSRVEENFKRAISSGTDEKGQG